MAFIDIKDPKKRDAIVADYLSTIKHVQQQNEDERTVGLQKDVELEKTFKPIIKATEKSTAAITKELEGLKRPTIIHPSRKRKWDGTIATKAIDYYLNTHNKQNLDKYYGIQRDDNNELVMGDKIVTVDGNSNIHVDNAIYKGTTGLWSLIMSAAPKDDSYTERDLEEYSELARKTDVINHPRSVGERGRPLQTVKRRMLETITQSQNKEVAGSGIQFLPGDIRGLHTKLNLLLAEFHAGNTSTRNEIVSILDELLRRKRMSRREYTDINTFLASSL